MMRMASVACRTRWMCLIVVVASFLGCGDRESHMMNSIDRAQFVQCSSNLRGLHQLFAMSAATPTDKTGTAFLKSIAGPSGSGMGAPSILRCTLREEHHMNGDFRGPFKTPKNLAGDGILACDRPDNHPDGSIHVLTKDGVVTLAEKDSDLYKRALSETSE